MELRALDGLLQRSLELRSSVRVEVCQRVACCSQREGCCNSPTSRQWDWYVNQSNWCTTTECMHVDNSWYGAENCSSEQLAGWREPRETSRRRIALRDYNAGRRLYHSITKGTLCYTVVWPRIASRGKNQSFNIFTKFKKVHTNVLINPSFNHKNHDSNAKILNKNYFMIFAFRIFYPFRFSSFFCIFIVLKHHQLLWRHALGPKKKVNNARKL